jgi:NitT/TauT family transport system ATP-binding protein
MSVIIPVAMAGAGGPPGEQGHLVSPSADPSADWSRSPAAALPAERLVFEEVSHTFPDGTRAVDRVSLSVHSGEFVALIGPSGCGKSTLLRLGSGLLQPTGGSIRCNRDNIGFVFQDPTLLPYRTVLSNVELFGELKGIPKAERRRRALDALHQVGLAGSEHKYPKALSGGMKMRASLARSLILNPTLFFFDEPFAAVDEITRNRLNNDLTQLFSRERFASVFVTHSIPEACYLASRVIVMSRAPAHIMAEVPIPFPFPRTEDLRFDAEFSERAREVSARLHESGA